jgi:hypothetical protein
MAILGIYSVWKRRVVCSWRQKMNSIAKNDMGEYLQSLVVRTGEDLISVHSRANQLSKHGLIFPRKREGSLRVSEQEGKHLFIQHVRTDKRFCYSLETPTRQTYCQKGTSPRSANVDMTIVGPLGPVNVEFKAGYCGMEYIRKDLEKLIREDTTGVWFHTIERGGSLQSLFATFREAFNRLSECAATSKASYLVSICSLDVGLVHWRWLDFTGDLNLNLDAINSVFGTSSLSSGEWEVLRFGTNPPGEEPNSVMTFETISEDGGATVNPSMTFKGRGPREGYFIYADTIANDTYMHLSVRGRSYRIRNFHLTGAAIAATDFMITACPTIESLRSSGLIAKCISVTAADLRHNLIEEPGYWHQRIDEINQREIH